MYRGTFTAKDYAKMCAKPKVQHRTSSTDPAQIKKS